MVIYTTKPIKEINKVEFQYLIKGKELIVSPHAIWHLSNQQRKVFNKEELINMILRENPNKVYLQENKRYAAFYRKSDGYRKLIIEIKDNKTTIVTFVDMDKIPNYKL
jgi:mRNA-degrading endonuclease RelE of RelBE toxin-antitoxin system